VQRFDYRRAQSLDAALAAGRTAPAAAYLGGGTNLVDYMTLEVLQPQVLVDINELPPRYAQIDANATRLRLGALARMAQAEDHPAVRESYPVIRESLLLAASRQIRNMASLGGNLLQQTRCEYFRGRGFACNRRSPGTGCAALDGLNRAHAVLGTSDSCIATYAGDFAQALIALDATVEIAGPAGSRRLPFAQLHRLPADTPHIQTALAPGELITFIDVPAGAWTRRSRYVKVRDRDSYQFAITSAAVALDLEGETVRAARIALGGVATVPWRAHEAEAVLAGKTLDVAAAERAAEAAFAQARPRRYNAFKIPLGKQTLVRALLEARSMTV
jgi:xanthine dehydrogenase YagS FAD-binding subunit